MSRTSRKDPFGHDEAEVLSTYQLRTLEPRSWNVFDENIDDIDATEVSSSSKRDVSDPLGLRQGSILQSASSIPFEDKMSILLHSKEFDSKKFLARVHPNATLNDLSIGRRNLQDALKQRSQALRVLVEKEFDHFVKIKAASIDVYSEMKQGPFQPQNDYSVKVLKDCLAEASSKADAMYTPIRDARQKAERLRSTLGVLERSTFFFNLPATLSEAIEQSRYDAALMAYKKGLYMHESRSTFLFGSQQRTPITDAQKQQSGRIFDKVWGEVEIIVSEMKSNLERRLKDRNASLEEVEKILDVLLEFDSNDDSVWVVLTSRHQFILDAIQRRTELACTRHKAIIDGLSTSTDQNSSILHLQSCFKSPNELDEIYLRDHIQDTNAWKALLQVVNGLSETILTHFTPFWKLGKAFTDGKYSKKGAPVAKRSVEQFKDMAHNIINAFSSSLSDFFQLSSSETDASSFNGLSAASSLPSFAPAMSNALTAGTYMQMAIAELNECTEDLGALGLSASSNELLKDLITKARVKFEDTLCSYWVNDARQFYGLESWTPDVELPHTTDFWRKMNSYQLRTMKLAYRIAGGSEESADAFFTEDTPDKKLPKPRRDETLSQRCVRRIQSAYLDTLYAFLDGLVHVAFSPVMQLGEENSKTEGDASQKRLSGAFDIENVDVRILFTMSNLSHFQSNVMDRWIEKAGSAFKNNLSEDVKTLSEVFTQLDKILFDDLIRRRVEEFESVMQQGVLGPDIDWAHAPRPVEVQPYIYQCLIRLVLAHAQVGAVTKPLIQRVIGTLIDEFSRVGLECFQQVQSMNMGGMLQATLDIEFAHQTLQGHVSPQADSNLQEIYKLIYEVYYSDPTAKEPERKQELQNELEKLRKTLSASRRATALQFLCFRSHQKKKEGTSRE